jgi:hypothetical protein
MRLRNIIANMDANGLVKGDRILRPLKLQRDRRLGKHHIVIDDLADDGVLDSHETEKVGMPSTASARKSRYSGGKGVSRSTGLEDIPFFMINISWGITHIYDRLLSEFIFIDGDYIRENGQIQHFRLMKDMVYVTLSTEFINQQGGIIEGKPYWEF